jgi:hypothetical protein
MRSISWITILLLALGTTGCGILLVSTAAVVGVVGVAGYTVYKGGEAVVSGVESVGSSAKSLVVSDGVLKAKCDYPVDDLYAASSDVLREAGFTITGGAHDSLAGEIRARTVLNEAVLVTFELLDEDLTLVEIKVGDGNLEQSEFLYEQMLAKVVVGEGGGA